MMKYSPVKKTTGLKRLNMMHVCNLTRGRFSNMMLNPAALTGYTHKHAIYVFREENDFALFPITLSFCPHKSFFFTRFPFYSLFLPASHYTTETHSAALHLLLLSV